MGEVVELNGRAVSDPTAVRQRLDDSIVALDRMLADGMFASEANTCGLEVELDLVDPLGRPRLVNDPVLAAMDRRDFQPELGRFNLELNAMPRPVGGLVLRHLDAELDATIAAASAVALPWGARVVSVGLLPTLHAEDMTADCFSANPRYPLLDAVMAASRQHTIRFSIVGTERVEVETETIGVQAAATSLQVHLRAAPQDFARFYNAAQAAAPAQLAAGSNSPYLLGRRLWHETRIPLLEQALDIRPAGATDADHPPRAWFGDRWARGPSDVLADNVQRYPSLLPVLDAEDPLVEVAAGRVPALHELRLHNGTVWRWNRPVYDVQHGYPHLRVENRVLPSGPTAVDMIANVAFFLGLVRGLADQDPPVCYRVDFPDVADDLHRAARLGLAAELHHVDAAHSGTANARTVILDSLLPLAAEGLDAWGIDPADRDHYLGVIEDRVRTGRTGSEWQTAHVVTLQARSAGREGALREMVRRYVEHARTGEPVHTWPL